MRHRSPHLLLLLLLSACDPAAPSKPAATASQTPPPQPYLLHLPGVSGESIVDHTLIDGFREGHLDAKVEIYDWTDHDPGVPALQATARHKKHAKLIAEKLTATFRADPRVTIYLTSHSGGAGLAVWALENLPADVKVERAIFLAPALSPNYDLTAALTHVRDKAYMFYSDRDTVVLSVGTKMFGTIDGVYTDAAGYNGFKTPPQADAKQYAKLVQMPYDPAWAQYGDFGDHIGVMATEFSKAVLVPLIEGRALRRADLAWEPTMTAEPSTGIAPADAKPHAPWPTWKKALAYSLLSAISLAAIWFVDVKVHRPAVMPRSMPIAP